MTRSLHVVLVEDNDALRLATSVILVQAGFEVSGVACAEDVDDLPTARVPDLYVIDVNLPGEDGFSLAARLRRARPWVGIVITSARTRVDDRVHGYEQGVDVYLPKPVNPPELLAVLRSLGQRLQSRQTRAPGLELHQRSSLLSGSDGSCRLTEAELRLLLALAAARGQTLERWQVAVQLSPGEDDMRADNLQNRLSHLRKKLQVCGVQGESIKAVRGIGYRLRVPLVVV
jgi:DNA-binding response OmpR family regulator